MLATKPRKTREERLSIRTTIEIKELIARAAEKENKNISDFVLENAVSAAEAIVGDDAILQLIKVVGRHSTRRLTRRHAAFLL